MTFFAYLGVLEQWMQPYTTVVDERPFDLDRQNNFLRAPKKTACIVPSAAPRPQACTTAIEWVLGSFDQTSQTQVWVLPRVTWYLA